MARRKRTAPVVDISPTYFADTLRKLREVDRSNLSEDAAARLDVAIDKFSLFAQIEQERHPF